VSGGGSSGAQTDGTLAILVGGDDATIERIAALLGAMGTSIFRTGALGSGHAMKALNNYVSSAGLDRDGRSPAESAASSGSIRR